MDLKVKQILPSWLSEQAVISLEFVHIGVREPRQVATLLRKLQAELPLQKMRVSPEAMAEIRNAGVVTDTTSPLFGEFKLPGVLTNDLVNNKEFKDQLSEEMTRRQHISMSHVKRVKKASDGSLRVLICTKWQYENNLSDELKKEIRELACPSASDGDEESSLETVILPDRLVYIREIYNKLRIAALEWPIVFNTQPPSFQFLSSNFDLPSELKVKLAKSHETECRKGSVCILANPKTLEIATQLEAADFEDSSRSVIDHPIMMLAAKAGKLAIERQ